ncbi:hypothetical protein CRG98_037413 [Punica granatum]|uniref:CCHC-type domain-containing protein n=1 Tax=Punica granatum TaxID=22663 RepID=A0A2I0IDU0_PUNGR|nr:hypothetical protein CRG98_037413 [Punica granatum]
MDVDYASHKEKPPAPTDTDAPEVKEKYEWWEKSNHLSLMLMMSFEYEPYKISYNTNKEEWSIIELLTMCVQEDERMKQDKPEIVHLATRPKGKGKKDYGKRQYKASLKTDGSKVKCFFCRKDKHVKKDCLKYKKWLEKRGLSQPKESDGK